MNYIEHDKGIEEIVKLLLEKRLIPIFGAGFSKSSPTVGKEKVPDSNECVEIMKSLIKPYLLEALSKDEFIEFESYNFNATAKLMKKMLPKNEYLDFFRSYFTGVNLSQVKVNFLKLPWLYVFTLNIDDGIENTNLFTPILPYHNARKDYFKNNSLLFKLHGDAKYELKYESENNIIFDSDQYIRSLKDIKNKTMCEYFSNTLKEYNLLFIGCSLQNEPDIKYIYNNIADEHFNTKKIILRTKKLSFLEEANLQDYGITDVILVKDYGLFYADLFNAFNNIKTQEKVNEYPFKNPQIKNINDLDLKYFSGFKCFKEEENAFYKTDLIIERECIVAIENSLKFFNIVFVEGRRFSGKTSLICTLCEKEKWRTIFFFPSTTQEDVDVILDIINNNKSALLIFDSNSLSNECYFLLKDIEDILQKNDNKIIVFSNQSDNYLPEIIKSAYFNIANSFSDKELNLLTTKTDIHALIKRKKYDTNLDYLDRIKKEQGSSFNLTKLTLPSEYTKNEQILLLLLCVKDKIYSRDIFSLKIKYEEIKTFLKKVPILCEWLYTTKEESNTHSVYKLVHNSKNIILREIRKIKHDDIITNINSIVIAFKDGDKNQKRIYHEVMQFDTLNYLFGRKKGAGRLISKVYKNLEDLLNDDLHFWLQRSKSIYHLASNNYDELKFAYSYAKKAYIDSNNRTLTTKAALSVSLICSLLYKLEKDSFSKIDLIEEAIKLGYEAIFSEYYRQEKRLVNDLNIGDKRDSYASLIIDSCNNYISFLDIIRDDIFKKAKAILNKLIK